MNKIVYNKDHGVFALSIEAIHWLEENATDLKIKEFIKTNREECIKRLTREESDFVDVDDMVSYNLSKKIFNKCRHHKDLIKCVEDLGYKVNACFSTIDITEISGDLYRIDNYDGKETVVEPKDYEWIHIDN